MLSKETIRSGPPSECGECDTPIEFRVCSSFAGYYIGTYCDDCGPLSRESEYYTRRRDAERDLRDQTVRWRR